MTSHERVDVAVIGRGLIGSGAGRHLAESGRSVALIGPGEPSDWKVSDGPFSSHHDQGRITRIAGRNAMWTEVAAHACARYADIEARSGIGFHTPRGVLVVYPDAADWVARAEHWGSDAR
ncbi:MAG: FAD-dependent oxidoreductase, partial [Acidimicrobiia bacterium]|nr:FAD-dependent oxidoreductase [Acidimicrobiia bacterium]